MIESVLGSVTFEIVVTDIVEIMNENENRSGQFPWRAWPDLRRYGTVGK